MRRIPSKLQGVVGPEKGIWDYSLGSDYAKAVTRCVDLTRQTSGIIRQLADDGALSEFKRKSANLDAAECAELALGYEDGPTMAYDGREVVVLGAKPTPPEQGWINFDGTKENQELWRTTEAMLISAEHTPKSEAYERLANFAVAAFGDTKFVIGDNAFTKTIMQHGRPMRPDDMAGGAVYDALHGALETRLRGLSVTVSPDAPDRVGNLLKPYAKQKALKPSTKRDYEKKIGRFIEYIETNPRVSEITRENIQGFRDHLAGQMEVSSLKGYMAPINALLAYALDERLISSNPAHGVRMPVDPKRVEDRKFLPFTREEVRQTVGHANDIWADENNKSRLSIERRRLYCLTTSALLYTGARPHELWRLRPEDTGTHTHHGWTGRGFDIRDTKSGVRLIPCPVSALPFADLIAKGGLKCLSKSGDDDPTGTEIEHMIKAFSGERQFGKLLVDLKIKRPRASLYSTRTTFVTALQNNGYADGIIENVIGHVGSAKMLRHYKTRAEMEDMLVAMDSISYE